MNSLDVIFDTSPLITLCAFRVSGTLVIDLLLPYLNIYLVETVAREGTANPTHTDSAKIISLLNNDLIKQLPIPDVNEAKMIDAYTKLGAGERDSIRLGIQKSTLPVIFDDYLALVIANRFGITTHLLLDLLVLLSSDYSLDKDIALNIINAVALRYSAPFVEHTRYKLNHLRQT